MDRIEIDTWASISAESWSSLLLGNGASIAIHKEFAYPTLHSVADAKGLLATTAPIFAKLGTTDFEHVLLACWYAEHVNAALGWLHVVSCGKQHRHWGIAGANGLAGRCLSLDMRR